MKDNNARTYRKPAVERFGTFRDLTQLGFAEATDFAGGFGIAGCNSDDTSSEYSCGRS